MERSHPPTVDPLIHRNPVLTQKTVDVQNDTSSPLM